MTLNTNMRRVNTLKKYCTKITSTMDLTMPNQFTLSLTLFFLLAAAAYAEDTITYTVENQLEGFTFNHTIVLNNENKTFYSYMLDAQSKNPFFRFKSKDYGEPLGHFITSVNGLQDDMANEKFWGFLLRRPEEGDCKIPVGVSSYVPHPDDHVVLSYITFDMLSEFPTCD